ncbi:MAG: bifunctional RNase H/acid phosphatase [Actinobacteria bacterium]|nr:bifunctional RNase H/acid phosphatase [Actinomycetota bacterium]
MVDLIVEADGGSRGNPGVAGYGALVRCAASRRVLAERAAPLGRASNNVAEYTGLIEGLRVAAELDPAAAVEVRMDSKLVVEQMSGRWKIKHEDMRRLALQARELVQAREAAGGSVVLTWIPRESNKAADRLSNLGMDGETVDRRLTDAADSAEVTPDESDVADEPEPPEPLTASSPTTVWGEARRTVDVARGAAAARTGRAMPNTDPDLGAPVRIVLVRHGVTEATAAGLLDGRGGADPALTAEGQRQAVAAAAALRSLLRGEPALVVTSSLARAVQTGAAIAGMLGARPQTDPDWDEQHFGDWEGRTVAQVCATADGASEYARLRTDADYARPGGESRAQLQARVLAAYEAVEHCAREAGRPVVVVSHRAALIAVLDAELGLGSPWSLALSPASLTALRRWADGTVCVDVVNDTSHLRG